MNIPIYEERLSKVEFYDYRGFQFYIMRTKNGGHYLAISTIDEPYFCIERTTLEGARMIGIESIESFKKLVRTKPEQKTA